MSCGKPSRPRGTLLARAVHRRVRFTRVVRADNDLIGGDAISGKVKRQASDVHVEPGLRHHQVRAAFLPLVGV